MAMILLAGFVPLLCGQTIWHVATNGLDTNTGQDWSSPYLTIGKAVEQAAAGDAVLVSNGVYETSKAISLTKAVHLNSVNGPEVTVISGAGNHHIFTLTHEQAFITGLTITNGFTSNNNSGGGMWMNAGVVSNCVLAGNRAAAYGGGIYCENGLVTHCKFYGNSANNGGGIYCGGGLVSNCHFEQNGGTYGAGVALFNDAVGLFESIVCNNLANSTGGGIYMKNSTGMVYNCHVYSNTAAGTRGGGIHLNESGGHLENLAVYGNRTESIGSYNCNGGGGIWAHSLNTQKILIRNALIYNNYSYESAGGIYSYSSSIIENSTIVSNYAACMNSETYAGGGGIALYNSASSTNTIRNCIIQFNDCANNADNWQFRTSKGYTAYTNNCMGPGKIYNTIYALPPANCGGSNFSDDPLFVDRESNDWHLQQGSPCIDAGIEQDWMANAFDLDGHPRLDWLRRTVDLGCYEYVPSGAIITIR